jgi:hypothetical protein
MAARSRQSRAERFKPPTQPGNRRLSAPTAQRRPLDAHDLHGGQAVAVAHYGDPSVPCLTLLIASIEARIGGAHNRGVFALDYRK